MSSEESPLLLEPGQEQATTTSCEKEDTANDDYHHKLLLPTTITTTTNTNTNTTTISFAQEAWDIFKLAIPIFVARSSFVGMKTTDTALLGHVSRPALAASALSDLWTMCTQVVMSGRILGVFVGAAVGAGNPQLAGIYLQVSLVVLGSLSVLVFIAWNLTQQVWLAINGTESNVETTAMAGYYARVLSLAIPAIVTFRQLSQFFAAQRILHPEQNSALVGLALNLILGLLFVVGWPIQLYLPGGGGGGWEDGFMACPVITTVVAYVQLATLFIVYMWYQRLHEPCWGGWDWTEITYARIQTYCELYFPAAMALASDFWRVAVIGAIAAVQLGEEQVAVVNTSYRIMWIALAMVGAVAGASAIHMTLRLGQNQPQAARQAGQVGIVMAAAILGVLSLLILCHSRWFGKIFTNDEVFLHLFEEASVPFTITLFFMNLAVAIERIPYSMGRTREVFWMGFVASWGGQVPCVILCTQYWRNDLVGLYTGMAIGYGMLVVLYSYIVLQSDWEYYAQIAQKRSEVSQT